GARNAGHHPLPAPARLHRPRPHPRSGQRKDRRRGRQGTGARTRSQGLRAHRGQDSLMNAPATWLDERRAEAANRFAALGVPHRRIEDWKYSDLKTAIDGANDDAAAVWTIG